jgi:hypothetical protein
MRLEKDYYQLLEENIKKGESVSIIGEFQKHMDLYFDLAGIRSEFRKKKLEYKTQFEPLERMEFPDRERKGVLGTVKRSFEDAKQKIRDYYF